MVVTANSATRALLTARLVEFELVTAKSFAAFWTEVTQRRYDIVHYNQYHYIRSASDYEVIAHIEEFGKSTIAGAI